MKFLGYKFEMRHVVTALVWLQIAYLIGPAAGYVYHTKSYRDYQSAFWALDSTARLFIVTSIAIPALVLFFPQHFSAFCTAFGYNPVEARRIEDELIKAEETRERLIKNPALSNSVLAGSSTGKQ